MLKWGFGALLVHGGAAPCRAQPGPAGCGCAGINLLLHLTLHPSIHGEGSILVNVTPTLTPEKVSVGDNGEQPSKEV